jgi:beta-1,4-mannooligosaccharide/beta-1,4-mannosyl-N-acetylglucosamine phosphorylase
LLDLEDPTIVKARTAIPLFEPEAEYEHKGIVANVVFPCGLTVRGTNAYIYYGAADLVTGVATVKVSALLRMLEI